MGIHKLYDVIKKYAPECMEKIHLSTFAFKKVAIDVSLFMFKFKAVCGDRWLQAFLNLVTCLRRNEIHCVFIYDTDAPPEKELERAERRESKEKMEENLYNLEQAYEHYLQTNEIEQILIDLYKKEVEKLEKPTSKEKGIKTLLNRGKKYDINVVDMKLVVDKIEHKKRQIVQISGDDFALTKKMFDILQVPWYQAPMEAETMCSDLCKRGLVDAVLSEDTDVLAYGAPIFLSKIETDRDTCVLINYDHLLNTLELTYDQFLDMCIMCGTDYNKNIPKIGPDRSYNLIKKYETIENVAKGAKLDISILNHNRGRELFKEYLQADLVKIPYCGRPDFNVFEEFVKENKINVNLEKMRNVFTKNNMVFIDEVEEVEEVEETDEVDENMETDNLEEEIVED